MHADPSGFILFPLVVHSFDLVVSSVGILSIRGKRDSGLIGIVEDPMAILQKGYSVTIVLAVVTFGLVIFLSLSELYPSFLLSLANPPPHPLFFWFGNISFFFSFFFFFCTFLDGKRLVFSTGKKFQFCICDTMIFIFLFFIFFAVHSLDVVY